MYAFRIQCDHLAGSSLTEEGQVVEFDADGISSPVDSKLAEFLTGIPGFSIFDTVEVVSIGRSPTLILERHPPYLSPLEALVQEARVVCYLGLAQMTEVQVEQRRSTTLLW